MGGRGAGRGTLAGLRGLGGCAVHGLEAARNPNVTKGGSKLQKRVAGNEGSRDGHLAVEISASAVFWGRARSELSFLFSFCELLVHLEQLLVHVPPFPLSGRAGRG